MDYTQQSQAERPVARYIVEWDGQFHWLVRCSTDAVRPISPYTNDSIAWEAADHLNKLVRWEAT